MLGCIPIIHPLANMNKREWLNSPAFGGYMDYYDVEDAYGIAYGWDEVQYARQTLHLVRDQLWAVKEFAASVTVRRFVHDIKRAASGQHGPCNRGSRTRPPSGRPRDAANKNTGRIAASRSGVAQPTES